MTDCIFSNKYGKLPEDLTDDWETKKALQLCGKIDTCSPQMLKSPHVSMYVCNHIVMMYYANGIYRNYITCKTSFIL